MTESRFRALISLVVVGVCACAIGVGAPVEVASEAQATARIEDWLDQEQGFDALQAFEIIGPEGSLRFGLARKWDGERAKILSYPLEFPGSERPAVLVIREPGWRAIGQMFVPRRLRTQAALGGASNDVVRIQPLAFPLRSLEGTALAGVVATPLLPGDLGFVAIGEETLDGVRCYVIDGTPRRHLPQWNRLRVWLDAERGVALRRTYFSGAREVRRVDVARRDLADVDGRWVPRRWTITVESGATAEIRLRNQVADPHLPDQLFSRQALRAQHFPEF